MNLPKFSDAAYLTILCVTVGYALRLPGRDLASLQNARNAHYCSGGPDGWRTAQPIYEVIGHHSSRNNDFRTQIRSHISALYENRLNTRHAGSSHSSKNRHNILEALEDLSDMGDDIFQAQCDFNENDYELLLALDENNHQHAGASSNQISSLPVYYTD